MSEVRNLYRTHSMVDNEHLRSIYVIASSIEEAYNLIYITLKNTYLSSTKIEINEISKVATTEINRDVSSGVYYQLVIQERN